jgi:hypothetical protein
VVEQVISELDFHCHQESLSPAAVVAAVLVLDQAEVQAEAWLVLTARLVKVQEA